MVPVSSFLRQTFTVAALAIVFASGINTARADIGIEDFSAYLTLTSDYRFRGLSQTDGGAALQAAIDFEHDTGVFMGIWASNVEFQNASYLPEESRDIELDFYLGIARSFARNWTGAVSVVRYVYPDTTTNYDYTEFSAGLNYKERVFANIAYSNDAYSLDGSAVDYELMLQYPLPYDIAFGATLGLYDSDDLFNGSYKYWNMGLSRNLNRLTVDVRFYDTDNRAQRLFGSDVAGSEWVASVSVALLP